MIRIAIIVLLTLGAVGTAVLWYGSYCPRDPAALPLAVRVIRQVGDWAPPYPGDHAGLEAYYYLENGGTLAVWSHFGTVNLLYNSRNVTGWRGYQRDRDIQFVGFRYAQSRSRYGHLLHQIGLPYPALLGALLSYPTIAFIRGPLRRWRRRRKCLCTKCGYNLTGNVTGTCPECGESF